MNYLVIAAATILALAGFVTKSEARTKPVPATNAGHFAKELKGSGMFEIQSSTLALQKSNNDAVKKFAQKMIDDHKAADGKLTQTLKQANLPEPKEGIDEQQQALLNKLVSAEGATFDRRYIQDQIQAHRQAVELLETYEKRGDNNALKQLASSLLPTIKEHLSMAEGLRGGPATARR